MPRRLRLSLVAATAAAALGVTAPAHAGGFHSPVPAGARDLGSVPRSQTVHATIALAPRDPAALAAYAKAVSTPGAAGYHHYLSVAQFARRFGPSAASTRAVRAHLRARGLTVGAPSANGLSLPVSAPAAVASAAFATAIHRYAVGGDGVQQLATAHPTIDDLGGAVQGVVGLGEAAPVSSARVAHAAAAKPCGRAASAAAAGGAHTPDQIAAAYGMSSLRSAGVSGAGVTIALYELEPFADADVAAYQACVGSAASIATVPVDGGAGVGAGSGEAAMDVEDLAGLAPRATIRVYEGPQTGLGAFDTFSRIVTDDSAKVISSSWGLCESLAGPATILAEGTLLQEAAVQGQTFLAASGDEGADDCGTGARGVDDPASQPWATAVGGTSLNGSVDSAWSNALGATGGGASAVQGRPAYQAGVAPSATTREVPDLSADADPNTGYAAFYGGAWRTVGGTSVSAPTVAALIALAESSPACAGRSLGFVNPALYASASALRDVTAGVNSFGGVPGFGAGPGYDMASGLGVPTAALGPALCHDAVTIAAPGAQRWTAGRAAALQLSATSAVHGAIGWTATGLPAGVTLDPASGRISGKPTTAGPATVTVTATDSSGATATVAVAVTVAKAPAAASATSAKTHGRRHHRSAARSRRHARRGAHGARHSHSRHHAVRTGHRRRSSSAPHGR